MVPETETWGKLGSSFFRIKGRGEESKKEHTRQQEEKRREEEEEEEEEEREKTGSARGLESTERRRTETKENGVPVATRTRIFLLRRNTWSNHHLPPPPRYGPLPVCGLSLRECEAREACEVCEVCEVCSCEQHQDTIQV